jgi:hypothetical protein
VSNAALRLATENECNKDREIKVHIRRKQLHVITWNGRIELNRIEQYLGSSPSWPDAPRPQDRPFVPQVLY